MQRLRKTRDAAGPSMLVALVWILLAATAFAGETGEDDGEEMLRDAHGTIQKVGNFGYGIVPDADPGTRYAPTVALAEEFCEDGLRVIFSGRVGDPDENAARGRRWGTPLEVTAIERLSEDAADDDS